MNGEQTIAAAEKWARVGERSFWNWYQTLGPAERCVVDRWFVDDVIDSQRAASQERGAESAGRYPVKASHVAEVRGRVV